MHMFYRLRKNLVRERQATDELRKFCVLNARIHAVEGGFVLLVPAGRRPASVLKFLNRHSPEDDWDIVGWDDDDGVTDLPELPANAGGSETNHEHGYLADDDEPA